MHEEPTQYAPRDHFVVLDSEAPLGVAQLQDALVGQGILKGEITRAAKRQRGIIFGRRSEEDAGRIAEALCAHHIHAIATPIVDVQPTRRVKRMTRVEILDDGFYFPGAASVGEKSFISGDEVVMIAFGLVAGYGTIEGSHDPVELAKQAFEAEEKLNASAPREAFPLSDYLLKDPQDMVNLARLTPEKEKKAKGAKGRLQRFDQPSKRQRYQSDHPGLGGRLWLETADTDYLLEAETAVFERRDESSLGHWLRPFHAMASDAASAIALSHGRDGLPPPTIIDGLEKFAPLRLGECLMPPATQAFALAFDHADYLFEDADAFLEHVWWWRLNRHLAA